MITSMAVTQVCRFEAIPIRRRTRTSTRVIRPAMNTSRINPVVIPDLRSSSSGGGQGSPGRPAGNEHKAGQATEPLRSSSGSRLTVPSG